LQLGNAGCLGTNRHPFWL